MREYEEYDYNKLRQNDLKPLRHMTNLVLERGVPDIRGWKMVDDRGDSVGSIDDFLISAETQKIVFVEVSHGGILGIGATKTLVPIAMLDVDEEKRHAVYRGSAEDVKNAPEYSHDTSDFGDFYDYWASKGGRVEAQPSETRTGEIEMPAPSTTAEERTPEMVSHHPWHPKHDELVEEEMAAGRKGGESSVSDENIKLGEEQSIEDLSGGKIKKEEDD